MPVWNGERWLAEALESILGQTFRDFELLLIDDGSTDRSAEIALSYGDERLRLISQEHAGLVEALNNGLAEARGEVVARMDADDVALPQLFERGLGYLDDHPDVALVIASCAMIDSEGRLISETILPPDEVDLRRRFLLRNPTAHGAVLVRRAALVDSGGYRSDYGHNEDYELWTRLAGRHRIAALPEVLFRFREHGGRITKATLDDRVRRRELLRDELWRDYDVLDLGLRELVRRGRGYRREPAVFAEFVADQRTIAREAYRHGRRSAAFRTALAATLLDPAAAVVSVKRALERRRSR
jgi:glycosyltransferase involved in cell wall biosynthesis